MVWMLTAPPPPEELPFLECNYHGAIKKCKALLWGAVVVSHTSNECGEISNDFTMVNVGKKGVKTPVNTRNFNQKQKDSLSTVERSIKKIFICHNNLS